MSNKMVIFDCDGVLVDSEILTTRIELEMLRPHGLEMTHDEFIATFVGQSFEYFYAELARRLGKPVPDSLVNIWEHSMRDIFAAELESVQGVPDLLSALRVKKAVGSNSGKERIALSLKTTSIHHHFDGGIFSAQMVENGKPAPDVYLLAASQNNIDPSNCIVVEDSFYGAKAGKAAGMHVIGFGAGGHILKNHRETMATASVDAYADNASDLLELINRALDLG